MVKPSNRPLRSGYTTGACAAAAVKAAALLFIQDETVHKVEIPFPDGSRHSFDVQVQRAGDGSVQASTVKDAGDDPDVTNRATIIATISTQPSTSTAISFAGFDLYAGEGVGTVTKPGLAVAIGEPAINPGPRQMIEAALAEVREPTSPQLHISISVTNGSLLAEKTLNKRLGIIGGLSILGTTGIVRPISASAWKATVSASMDVARGAGLSDIVLSTGRTSERGAQQLLELPEEAYAMMGDYLAFSLEEASTKGFQRIHYAGMWAKIMKAALHIPQTHVRNGALEVVDGAKLLCSLGASEELCQQCHGANTAREMLTYLQGAERPDLIEAICHRAKEYAEQVSGIPVTIYLINAQAEVIYHG